MWEQAITGHTRTGGHTATERRSIGANAVPATTALALTVAVLRQTDSGTAPSPQPPMPVPLSGGEGLRCVTVGGAPRREARRRFRQAESDPQSRAEHEHGEQEVGGSDAAVLRPSTSLATSHRLLVRR